MYLKTLELIGFKSFADRTPLQFEPGMTAIVGPNGCGKSNISDAIRWVLGEQSAKALRGSRMEDCIFSGTDDRKPLGMAEVSITFSDCEATLGTEYHEITVGRRVFRSGEGQYFINKTPCRLKDIQRLFMDTGIGTTSYSLMEQGRIDRVLSSRPEDRRAIFEEASGITKFKTDKEEALRKLEHTEANLLRLSDVIREVKRQIGSLQRQAGKARRYKALREELRRTDIHATRERLATLEDDIRRIEAELGTLIESIGSARREIGEMEDASTHLRKSIAQTERESSVLLEKHVKASTRLDHTHELIRVNRQRIAEYTEWSENSTREIEETTQRIDAQRERHAKALQRLQEAAKERGTAEAALADARAAFEAHQTGLDKVRAQIRDSRSRAMDIESSSSRLRNELLQVESKEKSDAIHRERLFAERAQLDHVMKGFEKRQAEMEEDLARLRDTLDTRRDAAASLKQRADESTQRLHGLRETGADLRSELAALEGQRQILREKEEKHADFPGGARLILDGVLHEIEASRILGPLADQLDIEPAYRGAVTAVLHALSDAVVVSDPAAAREVLAALHNRQAGSARLVTPVPADPSHGLPPPSPDASRLSDHVICPAGLEPLATQLLGNAFLVGGLDDLPPALPPAMVCVTRDGAVVRGNGTAEYFLGSAEADDPLSIRQRVHDLDQRIPDIQRRLSDTSADCETTEQELTHLRQDLDAATPELEASKHELAVKEGEALHLSRQVDQARDRLETVTWELSTLESEEDSFDRKTAEISRQIETLREEREGLSHAVETATTRQHALESDSARHQADVTAATIKAAELRQEVEYLQDQSDTLRAGIDELELAARSRSEGIASYRNSSRKLEAEIEEAEALAVALQQEASSTDSRIQSLTRNREKQEHELEEVEKSLAARRAVFDDLRSRKSDLELKLNEDRLRHQNQLDRVASEYAITLEQVMVEPEPDGDADAASMDSLETRVAELRTKLEAMGPVNLVAIEEYQELEERYAFLTQQEQDLVNAKQQLIEMIRKINRTTSEMFRRTFEAVNENFLSMFKTLFNGGSAKLVLVNEEDILECGIEIIARPPGKRLQNISLLSGGERTLTAVALLFSIYMIKPSPFCLLDEMDAALDDTNIGRFVKILNGFLEQSQFVVITHNRQSIAAADTLYGITMPERGVSKIVSMKFREIEKDPSLVT